METPYIPQKSDFKTTFDHKETTLVDLENPEGMRVSLTNYGARIVSILVPDKHGNTIDVNLGHSKIGTYLQRKANYYGAVVGRVCGRIRDAQFTIDDKNYQLPPNDGDNFIHGGNRGFHTRVFDVDSSDKKSVVFSYRSQDGEEGFPGNLTLKVKYELTADNELKLHYEAESDRKTPFNITNHAFFNLNGEGSGDVLDHRLKIFTDQYLPIAADILPVGKIAAVKGSPFDFTELKPIGRDIRAENAQIQHGTGYDHTFVLNDKFDPQIVHAAKAIGDKTGITMNVYTNQPGIHLYTGNFMDGSLPLKSGATDKARHAFCLETQHLADALNQPYFPSIVLSPDEKFKTKTVFKFSHK